MPQVDLETLVSACSGGDRKIACENDESPENDVIRGGDQANISELPPDFPPESFWLSKDAEIDWMNHNAFLERKESTKGISTHQQQQHPGSNSNSQRFGMNLPSKSAIIGLPKTQKASFVDAKRRNANKPGKARLFPKKTGIVGKSVSSLTEPSSPKVSCMGRVRSKRRSRRSSEPRVGKEKNKTGFCSGLMNFFKGKKPNSKSRKPGSGSGSVRETGNKVNEKKMMDEVAARKSLSGSRRARSEPGVEPPGLGGMKRFSSGRRSTDEYDGVV